MDAEAERRYPDYIKEEIPTPILSDEIWKLILDRSKIPETIIHMLKGEVWVTYQDKDGEIKGRWETRGEPLMNDKGIRFFTPLFYFTATPDKLTTFITNEETNRLTQAMCETVVDVLQERADEFGVPASNRSYVTRLIEQNYFMSLTGSRKGTILAVLKPTMERKEIYTPSPKPRQGFSMPKILGG